MKGLRTHRSFNDEGQFQQATIISDETGFMHEIEVKSRQIDNELYRKLTYTMTSLHTGNSVKFTNEKAEDLLYVVGLALVGSTSKVDGRPNFDKDWVTGPWDERFPAATAKKKEEGATNESS